MKTARLVNLTMCAVNALMDSNSSTEVVYFAPLIIVRNVTLKVNASIAREITLLLMEFAHLIALIIVILVNA